MTLRTIISNGDLVKIEPTMFGFGPWRTHRNLDDEVRRLETLRDNAAAKYKELSYKHMIASSNVADIKSTLQVILMEKSDAYFESDIDNSILERREGVKYNRGNNNKQGASSNKDNQNKQKQNQQNQQKKRQSNGGSMTLLQMLTNAKIVLH